MIQRTLFPVRYYAFDRVTGELQISNKPNGTIKHRYASHEITYVKVRDLFDMSKEAMHGRDMAPTDYPFLFLLETTERTFYLYAKTKEEREIWVHELSSFMRKKKDTPLNSVRGSVIEMIDPFEQMEI